MEGVELRLGDVVEMESDAEVASEQPDDKQPTGPLGLVQAMWQTSKGSKMVQVSS